MAKRTDWDVDLLPGEVSPWTGGEHADVRTLLRHRFEEDELETIAEQADSVRKSVLTLAVQELWGVPDTQCRLETLFAWRAGTLPFPHFKAVLGPILCEIGGTRWSRPKRREVGALMKAMAYGTLRRLADFVRADGRPMRQVARMVILERYAGMTTQSWEDLSLQRHVSERLLRREMRAEGLPTNHI